jgi:hypothetical protein
MLEGLTAVAIVIYYRCEACGAVFHVPKHDPDGRVVVVTDQSDPEA